jgi:hypothetical protein
MAWVVRAGEAKAADLVSGYRQHLTVRGPYGFLSNIRQAPLGRSWREQASFPMPR